MIDQNFCEFLEYELTKAFHSSSDEQLKGFWCDGILLPSNENEFSKKQINYKKQILLTAFAGKTGQDKYRLTIYFGIKALSRYSKGLSLEECLSGYTNANWLKVDIENKSITVNLD